MRASSSELTTAPGDAKETEFPQPTEKPENQTKEYERVPLLDWSQGQKKIPWQTLFLFSGEGCSQSGILRLET
jgi:hypothetical protein